MIQVKLDPSTDPRVQEALSIHWGYSAVVVPLRDGTFGVFARDRTIESLLIVDNPDDLSIAITSRANMSDRRTPSVFIAHEGEGKSNGGGHHKSKGGGRREKAPPPRFDFSDFNVG